ncbi:MAG: TIGR04282 family arsenosugar biosynthesis glycosyltransferase [Pseudonocardiaceae bacterium]
MNTPGTRPGAALLVVAKAPVPGRVKTRLSPPASPEQAAEIAVAGLLDTMRAVRAVPGTTPVVALAGRLDGACRAAELRAELASVAVFAQRGRSFGDRLAAAHADVAHALAGLPVLQIGMDTPQVSAELLGECAGALQRDGLDAVLGPATDGGWWALGLVDPRHGAVLRAVPMSRPDTGAATLTALRRAGLRVGLLPELTDVDRMTDARLVAAQLPGSEFAKAVKAVGQ